MKWVAAHEFMEKHNDQVATWNWDGEEIEIFFHDSAANDPHTWRCLRFDTELRTDLQALEEAMLAAPLVRAKQTIHGDWTDDVVPVGTLGRVMAADDPQDEYPSQLDIVVAFANGVVFNVSSVGDVEQVDL